MRRPASSTTRPVARATRRRRRRLAGLGLGLLLFSLVGVFLIGVLTHPAHAQANRYPDNYARMQAAVQAAGWPQQNGIWCGVSDIAAIADYRDPTHPVDQYATVSYLNSAAAQSAWGTPLHSSDAWGPGFSADISRDGGTDPRSMAAGLTALALGGYHQWVDYHSAYNATAHLVADLVRTQEPITVFVNAASHSVLVSAVYYYGSDPTNLDNVASLEVWDSGAGKHEGVQPNQVQQVSLNSWLWWWGYLGATYHENWVGGRALDPDPAVLPYEYDPTQGRNVHLWVGHYVYIHPDSPADAARSVSPDWAFNQDGALIRGLNGEVPAGYSGPSVAMYIPPPPPPPPPPTPTPTNTPIPTRPPAPQREPTEALDAPTPTIGPAPTLTAGPQPTPTSGSGFGFSLGAICVGSACRNEGGAAMWLLGGASSLSATLLLLAGAVLVRRRIRRLTPSAATDVPPGIETATTSATTAAVTPEANEGAIQGVIQGDTHVADGAAAPGEALDDTSPEDTSPLARLAGASERLVGLVETKGAMAGEAQSVSESAPTTPPAVSDATGGAGIAVPAAHDVASGAAPEAMTEAMPEVAPPAEEPSGTGAIAPGQPEGVAEPGDATAAHDTSQNTGGE